MTMTILPNLPEEIMLEIFSRTPAKSVGRFKCLSKLWLANLSTTQFINLHLTHHQQENLLLISIDRKLHTIAPPIRHKTVSKELSGLPGNRKRMFGSCNGLVLLSNLQDDLFLVNPVIQQQVRVPNPPLPCQQVWSRIYEMYGFGFGISKDDYKILSIATYYRSDIKGPDTLAHVYSLKMGVWKSLKMGVPYNSIGSFRLPAGAHVNGVIHWLSTDSCTLSTFNLADEVFGVIPLPDDNHISRLLTASVLRGCLILIGDAEPYRQVKACIMKEYGVHESWTNFTISIRGADSIHVGSNDIEPLYFTGENVVIMSSRGGSLLRSNLRTQEMKSMVVNGAQPYFHDGRFFIESLVSPSSFTLVAKEKSDETDFANNTLEAGPSQAPPDSSG